MLNIYELETKWLKYKIKSYIPHAVITLSIIVIAAIVLTKLNSNHDTSKTDTIETDILIEKVKHTEVLQKEIYTAPDINITSEKNILLNDIKEKSLIVQEMIPKNNFIKDKIVLTPSLNFMKNMQGNTPPYYVDIDKEEANSQDLKSEKQIRPKVFLEESNSEVDMEEVKEEKIIVVPVQAVKKEDSINITRQNTQKDISLVIKRFKKNNNPALSLFVAKKYYDIGEYRQAYNYSLITNQLNNNIESSWIIFTKSLVKLNEKEMAIKTLQQYIEYSHSNQAKMLLDEITAGKFK
ncbi:MAG: hypothetical protein AUK54_01585 [Helicobacteraceae bacterium CG2_30_36_10]|nr:MAG: hypothetical protein AUK54_01585 [Helicobacteraceae bacterium CG2_30_36_10]